MITEDYVSYETAKLVREKGFDEPVHQYYNHEKNRILMVSCLNWNKTELFCSSPTLQMVMKWLRGNHKLHIQIWILEDKGYWFNIEKILNGQYKHKSLYSTGLEDIYFDTYEEACEVAIKYCLENLI